MLCLIHNNGTLFSTMTDAIVFGLTRDTGPRSSLGVSAQLLQDIYYFVLCPLAIKTGNHFVSAWGGQGADLWGILWVPGDSSTAL